MFFRSLRVTTLSLLLFRKELRAHTNTMMSGLIRVELVFCLDHLFFREMLTHCIIKENVI